MNLIVINNGYKGYIRIAEKYSDGSMSKGFFIKETNNQMFLEADMNGWRTLAKCQKLISVLGTMNMAGVTLSILAQKASEILQCEIVKE